MLAPDIDLPAVPHVPGTGTVPDRVLLDRLRSGVPSRVCDENWQLVPPYLAGAGLYRAGYFWEAHEVWEPVWVASLPNTRERRLLVGLIQLANACLKVRMGRLPAALGLAATAAGHFGEAHAPHRPEVMGLVPLTLAGEVEAMRAAWESMSGAPANDLLQLRPALAFQPGAA